MKVLNDGAFNIPAPPIDTHHILCDSILIISRNKFPETYLDFAKKGYLSSYELITFDCLITKTNNGLTETILENMSVYTLSSYLNRRFLLTNVWYGGEYVTDPENPEPYMDFVVPHSYKK